MTSLIQIFRFLVGLGMVVAGGFVAAPFISSVLSTASREVVTQTPRQQTNPFDRDKTSQSVPNSFTVPGKSPQGSRVIRQINNPTETGLSRLEEILLPSQPQLITPERMPAHSLGSAPPGMYGAYRTTVEMPPPPLLDGSHAVASHRLQLARKQNIGPHREIPDSIPERYRVQDGDDLTGIATRLYGHPQAASALWQVNADRLSSPEVLPIGFEMIVPPAWRVFGKGAAYEGTRRIEPSDMTGTKKNTSNVTVHSTSMQSRALSQREKSSDGAGGPWLGSPPKLQPIHPQGTASKRSRGTIRVAPGETLASLAQRVYGNTHMADAIFDANRDRLRSPVLLVPGTELRLP
ncbi:MAG: LysM peptidoglycan-binding domain-containing protein [Pirellulales bacterium]